MMVMSARVVIEARIVPLGVIAVAVVAMSTVRIVVAARVVAPSAVGIVAAVVMVVAVTAARVMTKPVVSVGRIVMAVPVMPRAMAPMLRDDRGNTRGHQQGQ